ncbi:hypothetical protein T459_16355, partial [Capsicum annuum]
MKLQDLHATIVLLLPLLAVLPRVVANLNSDKQSLLQFAASVPHLRKLNWDSALPICNTWIGITCNKDGTRVDAIHLSSVGLFGHIPANSIGKLDALKVLSLRANNLNGNLLYDILSILLSTLSTFNIITSLFNSLSGAIPNFDSSRLSLLNLSYDMLNGSVPYSLKNFPLSSFVGNSNLSGTPLSSCSSSSPSHKGATSVIFLLVLLISSWYLNKKVQATTPAAQATTSSRSSMRGSILVGHCYAQLVTAGTPLRSKPPLRVTVQHAASHADRSSLVTATPSWSWSRPPLLECRPPLQVTVQRAAPHVDRSSLITAGTPLGFRPPLLARRPPLRVTSPTRGTLNESTNVINQTGEPNPKDWPD